MGPLDVVSLASAKDWLSLPDGDSNIDAHVTRLINTAVGWVENYTCHLLYQRPVVITVMTGCPGVDPANNFPPINDIGWRTNGIRHTPKGTSVYIYPFILTSVVDGSGNPANYNVFLNPLKTLYYAIYGTIINLNAGYSDPTLIPSPLIDACYKIITYLYENRDMYQMQYAQDIQFLLNQYRRAVI